MTDETKVIALNLISGQIAETERSFLEHPVFGKDLVEVEEGTKPFEASKYKPMTKDEFFEWQDKKIKAEKVSTEAEDKRIAEEAAEAEKVAKAADTKAAKDEAAKDGKA